VFKPLPSIGYFYVVERLLQDARAMEALKRENP
jgi:hypothetical protein